MMKKVLVAVEDTSLFGLLDYKLTKCGYEVTGAPDGPRALELLRESHFDIMLLDLMLPKVDGFQLLRELSDDVELRPAATIILSTRVSEEDILRSFELGAVDYVAKPFSLNVLVARMEIALRSKTATAA
jgi:DNA-binding response OmpR family regulator